MTVIIQSNEELEPGQVIHTGTISDREANHFPIAFRVIRKATEQEFKQFCKEQNAINDDIAWGVVGFYEVAMD